MLRVGQREKTNSALAFSVVLQKYKIDVILLDLIFIILNLFLQIINVDLV